MSEPKPVDYEAELRKRAETKPEPFAPCPACAAPKTCERIGCYQAVNAKPASQGPDSADTDMLFVNDETSPYSSFAKWRAVGFTLADVEQLKRDKAELVALVKRVAQCGTFTAELRDMAQTLLAKHGSA